MPLRSQPVHFGQCRGLDITATLENPHACIISSLIQLTRVQQKQQYCTRLALQAHAQRPTPPKHPPTPMLCSTTPSPPAVQPNSNTTPGTNIHYPKPWGLANQQPDGRTRTLPGTHGVNSGRGQGKGIHTSHASKLQPLGQHYKNATTTTQTVQPPSTTTTSKTQSPHNKGQQHPPWLQLAARPDMHSPPSPTYATPLHAPMSQEGRT